MSLSSGVLVLSLLLGLSAPCFATVDPITNDTSSPIYVNKNTTLILINDPVYGTRNVSYWATDDGLAIIDGDVIYGRLDDLLSRSLTGPQDVSKRAHSVYAPNTWPSATVTYKFDSATTESTLSAIVNGAIANWIAKAPYLTFTKVANSAVGENGVVMIQAPACGGCNSAIGFANVPLTMNLQQTCPTAPGSCGVAEATHEFGHLLGEFTFFPFLIFSMVPYLRIYCAGLYHEHQRFDRESFVHYHCENLNPACPAGAIMPVGKTCCDSGIPSGCCGTAGNFVILSGPSFDASGAYDVNSIMQYRASSFAIPGKDTLIPAVPGIVIPSINPSAIDSMDADRICKLYSAKCPLAISCHNAQCPSTCKPVKGCNKRNLCNDPPCCEPVSCTHEWQICSKKGCDFLK